MKAKASQSFLDMMSQAIDVEKQGYKAYMDNVKKLNNEFAKKVFQALANDEKKHIKALTEFYKNACKTSCCPAIKDLFKKSHANAKQKVLEKPLKAVKKIKPGVKVLKIYEAAKDLEEEGFKFYKSALKKAKSKDEKDLLKFLIKEENSHFQLLQETQKYLDSPGEWYLEQEMPIVEG